MPRRGIDLTEEEWATVKAHAARRRQTISQFFHDVLVDLGMDGRPRAAVTTRYVPDKEPGDFSGHVPFPVAEDDEFDRHPKTAGIGVPKPAPKPGKGAKR
jgi:hypothetical protein